MQLDCRLRSIAAVSNVSQRSAMAPCLHSKKLRCRVPVSLLAAFLAAGRRQHRDEFSEPYLTQAVLACAHPRTLP